MTTHLITLGFRQHVATRVVSFIAGLGDGGVGAAGAVCQGEGGHRGRTLGLLLLCLRGGLDRDDA